MAFSEMGLSDTRRVLKLGFSLQMPILTSRLQIREFQSRDMCDAYLGTLNDRTYMVHSRQAKLSHNYSSAQEYREELTASGGILLALLSESCNKLVGTIALRFFPEGQSVDLGMMIIREYGRYGYGREAWNAVVEAIRQARCVRLITAGAHKDNLSMLAIIQGSGFTRTTSDLIEAESDHNQPEDIRYSQLVPQEPPGLPS